VTVCSWRFPSCWLPCV